MAAITIAEAQALIAGISCDLCKIPQGLVWHAILAAQLDLNAGGTVADAQTLINEANCLTCVIPPGMVPYLLLQAMRNSGSGGGGSGSVISGAGAPVADPGVSAAVYFDTTNGTQYNWYSGAWH